MNFLKNHISFFSDVGEEYLVDFMGNVDDMMSMMESELKRIVSAAS